MENIILALTSVGQSGVSVEQLHHVVAVDDLDEGSEGGAGGHVGGEVLAVRHPVQELHPKIR